MNSIYLVHDRTRSLWVGTNGGHVYVYSIVGLESQSNNRTSIVTDQTNICSLGTNFRIVLLHFNFYFILAKEIRLKHKAPVLSIAVLDNLNQSVGQGSSIPTKESTIGVDNSTAMATNSEHVTSHKVLICSEEQFKVKIINFHNVRFIIFLRYLHYHI